MKTNSTIQILRTLVITFFFAFLTLNLVSQTSTKVSVTNYTFTPAQITITAGDTVIWKNNGGTHNVNGKQATFPSNPASFGNSLGSGWTYKFVFTTAGTYNYQCDPHAAMGMVGKVIVNPKAATEVVKLSDKATDNIRLYPNPASQYVELMVPPHYSIIRSLKIYSIAGVLIEEKAFPGDSSGFQYDISSLKNGLYLMEINSDNQKDMLKFLKQ